MTFRRDLPEEAEYSLKTDLAQVIRQHLEASSLVELLGAPLPWQLERKDDLITARLEWLTPEGWKVELFPYFSVVRRREGRGLCAFGPWGDGCALHEESGLILSESGGILPFSIFAQNHAWSIREARMQPGEYHHWFTGNPEDEA